MANAMQVRRFVEVLALAVLLSLSVSAGTTFNQNGKSIAFSDVSGNEWWVQAHLTGSSASTVSKVEAMQTGGSWVNLPKQSYGDWAASIHVTPGNLVQLRASWPDATQIVSCWFTHPAGVEQCTPPPPSLPKQCSLDSSTMRCDMRCEAGDNLHMEAHDTLRDGSGYPRIHVACGSVETYCQANTDCTQDVQTSRTANGVCYLETSRTTGSCSATTTGPPAAGQWTHGAIGSVPEGVYDMGIGDADRDGTPELYALGYQSGIFRFTHITANSADRSVVTPGCCWGNLVVGDGDRDGKSEVYATGPGGLHQFTWNGTSWNDLIISADTGGPLTLGDLDHDGLREIYVAGNADSSGINTTVTQVTFTGGAWHSQIVARMSVDPLSMLISNRVWIGDADRDGLADLVITAAGRAGPFVLMASHTSSGWSMSQVAVGGDARGIVAGDVDHDGLGEVAATDGAAVMTYTRTGSGWTKTQVTGLQGRGLPDITLADGDNDGAQELYLAASDMHAYQVHKGASWTVTDMGATTFPGSFADRIIAGDADGSGRQSVYMETFNTSASSRLGHIERYTWTPGSFGATFTMVQGNQWWEQAQVTPTGGTTAHVDVSVNGGIWHPLNLQSWGVREYAGSYQAVQGAIVQLRATSTTGATALSSCYQWIPASSTDAAAVPCGSPPPPPPPPPWNVKLLGVAGTSHGTGGMAVGDGKGDGMREVYVTSRSGVAQFSYTSSGWGMSTVTAGNHDRVAIGDADNNGVPEVYSSSFDSSTPNGTASVTRHTWRGNGWDSQTIATINGAQIMGLSLGDLDSNGARELYAITEAWPSPGPAPVLQIQWDGTAWRSTTIAMLPQGGMSLWVGDGDRSSKPELYVGAAGDSTVWQIKPNGTGWTAAPLGTPPEQSGVRAVVVGDVNRDGNLEVYAALDGISGPSSIYTFSNVGGVWQMARAMSLPSGFNVYGMFLGDAGGDGKQDLAVSGSNGHLYVVTWSGTALTSADVASLPAGEVMGDVVVGDGDNDGKPEVYVSGFNFDTCCPAHNIYRISNGAAPPPPPPGGLTATFNNVAGNNYWQEAAVSANKALAEVDVRVNCGATFTAMTYHADWGKWSAGIHINSGAKVDFRARATDGTTAMSGGYTWPAATATSAC